jgi:hypothetical protein
MTRAGFPHSDIHGSKLSSSSPWLFAGRHVLHRLLVPRHPPCALTNLTHSNKLTPVTHVVGAPFRRRTFEPVSVNLLFSVGWSSPGFCSTYVSLHSEPLPMFAVPLFSRSYERLNRTHHGCISLLTPCYWCCSSLRFSRSKTLPEN